MRRANDKKGQRVNNKEEHGNEVPTHGVSRD